MPHRSPFLQHLCTMLQHLGKSKPFTGAISVCHPQRLWVVHESCQKWPWEQANFYTLGPLGGIELAQHWPGEIWRQRLTCWLSPARAFSQVSAANLAVASCVLVPFLRAKSLKIRSITIITFQNHSKYRSRMHQELSGYRACILKLQQTSTAKLWCLLPALKMGLLLSRSLLSRQRWKVKTSQMVNQLTSSSSSSSNWCILYIHICTPQLFLWNPFSMKLSSQHSHASLPQFFRVKIRQGIWITGSSAVARAAWTFSSSPRRR